ncbi:MAG: hypothetical protein ACJ0A3_03600 [Dehalococcoidia bacterium]
MGFPIITPITSSPKFHWFGYYDKRQFDYSSNRVLSMEVDFEHRSPKDSDEITIGMIDLKQDNKWTTLGSTSAWNWQQGCMLQWLPGETSEVIWNVRTETGYGSKILDVDSMETRFLSEPIYALSNDGNWAVSTDFRRINDMRPGYGYGGIDDPNFDVFAPKDVGIWKIDLSTGEKELIFSLWDAQQMSEISNSNITKQWFNHLLISPDDSRISFLHRRINDSGKRVTQMFTINPDGKSPYLLDTSGFTSHYIWRDNKIILAWAKDGFYLFNDQSHGREQIGENTMIEDGHCTYLPDKRWVLNDTYPDNERLQHVYLFDTLLNKKIPVADLYSPNEYTGEWRCDTHPRSSPDGKKIIVDSPHVLNGRQQYVIDLEKILDPRN